MGVNLNTDTSLYKAATEMLLAMDNDLEIINVEIMGDASIKVWYKEDGRTCNWSVGIIYLVRKSQ